ncbi:MAG: hypothetical protein ACREYF_20215, partial [Gammaproteobacteria bacterium]
VQPSSIRPRQFPEQPRREPACPELRPMRSDPGDIAVTAPMRGFGIARRFGSVVQGLPERLYGILEYAFGHKSPASHGIEQILFAHQPPAPFANTGNAKAFGGSRNA